MKEYLSALLGVCVISTAVKALASDGVMKKYTEMLCTLCVLAVIISPAARIISASYGIDGLLDKMEEEDKNYDVIYNEYLFEKEIEYAEEQLGRELAEYLALDAEAISVKLEVSDGEDTVNVDRVKVYLGLQAVGASPENIQKYLYERTGAECQIIYDITNEK